MWWPSSSGVPLPSRSPPFASVSQLYSSSYLRVVHLQNTSQQYTANKYMCQGPVSVFKSLLISVFPLQHWKFYTTFEGLQIALILKCKIHIALRHLICITLW